jgi:YVTN family beta-propeller protein
VFPLKAKIRVALAAGLLASMADVVRADFVNFETPQVHPVAMSPDGGLLAVCNTADNRVELFDLSGGMPVAAGAVPVGMDPVTVRFRTNGELWVVNQLSDTVSVVDVAGRVVAATVPTRDEPADVVFAGNPLRAYVSCSAVDVVQVFDPGNLTAAPSEIVIEGEDPRAMGVSPDGATVYVAVFESGNRSTVLGGGGTNALGFPPDVVSDPAGPYGGVNPPPNDPGSATGFDPPLNIPNPPEVGLIVKKDDGGAWRDDNGSDWTALVSGAMADKSGRPTGWDVIDNDVAMIDTTTSSVTYVEGLMNICMALAVNPADGFVGLVGTDGTNEVRFEPLINGRFLRVLAGGFDPGDVPGTKGAADLNAGHLDYSTSTVLQAVRDQSIGDPRGLAWNLAGTRAYVTGMGSNNVAVVDAAGTRVGLQPTIEVGEGPTGIVIDDARNQAYVLNRFEGSLSVLDLVGETELTRVPFFDPTPPAVKTGRKHLYDTHKTSGLGHVSCASCHVDARMDRLAWDLGAPDGDLKMIDASIHNLSAGLPLGGNFSDFHPMKGAMTTQTLQDIIGKEPHHWRGDRNGIEEFNHAFVGLLGDDVTLTTSPAGGEMQEFEDYLATIHFPPNPFRNLDNSLPTDLPLPGHYSVGELAPAGDPMPNGNAERGLDLLYRNGGLDGGINCAACHALPTGMGTDTTFNGVTFTAIPPGPNGERHHALVSVDGSTQTAIKVPQLRNMYDKVGFEMTQLRSRAGFGFLHDGSIDSLTRFLTEPVFNPANSQDVADLVALMLAFSGSDFGPPVSPFEPPTDPASGGTASLDAHAAVGRQVSRDSNATGTDEAQLMDDLLALADAGAVEVIAKSAVGGTPRGWLYLGGGIFQTDEATVSEDLASLLGRASPGEPVTFMAVSTGCGERTGIERDRDGLYDHDETRDLVPEVPGIQNPFRADDPDATGDDGAVGPDGTPDGLNDFDGDGVDNATELQNGTNPVDNLVVNPPFNQVIAWDPSRTEVVIEWDAAPLGEYEISYTDDLVEWTPSGTGLVVAGASPERLQWVDDGPPATGSSPTGVVKRYYMINRIR